VLIIISAMLTNKALILKDIQYLVQNNIKREIMLCTKKKLIKC